MTRERAYESTPSRRSWWRRLIVFASRGNGRPGSVHEPLSRLPLPPRAWRCLTWALAAVLLAALPHTPLAFAGLFILFPLVWLVHTRFWAATVAIIVLGVGVAVTLHASDADDPVLVAATMVLLALISGTWVTRVQMARADALRVAAAKEEALEALAREHADRVAAEHAAGAAAERERWAREVHDTLAQGFVSVVTLAQAALAELEEGPRGPGDPAVHPTGDGRGSAMSDRDPGAHEPVPAGPDAHGEGPCGPGASASSVHGRLAQIEQVARENLVEARSLVEGRGPSGLRERGLAGALRRAVDALERGGVSASLDLSLPEELPPALQVVVLRLVQESLSNVVRHARAHRVEVAVAPIKGALAVSVADDGVGMGRATAGLGLTGMRTRVELLGGELTVGPGGGGDWWGRAAAREPASRPQYPCDHHR